MTTLYYLMATGLFVTGFIYLGRGLTHWVKCFNPKAKHEELEDCSKFEQGYRPPSIVDNRPILQIDLRSSFELSHGRKINSITSTREKVIAPPRTLEESIDAILSGKI